ncbi:MAG TPA: hypothetical protein VED40_04325 [Azospirillaceae bacterium]|nr:hypothetical protein [Azospirillaceae bacterium]
MALTKFLVARYQLLTAIDLFLNDRDPVSVHTLAGAAREIIEVLCRSAGISPFMDEIRSNFPERSHKSLYETVNLYRNSFKHAGAGKDDADILSQCSDEANDYLLYVCTEDYLRLRKAAPIEIQVMHAWFACMHFDRLAPAVDKTRWLPLFPGIQGVSRLDAKRMALAALFEARLDEELMSHPKTEPSALS